MNIFLTILMCDMLGFCFLLLQNTFILPSFPGNGLGHHIEYPPHKLGLKEWVLYAVSGKEGGGTSAGRTSSAEPNGGI